MEVADATDHGRRRHDLIAVRCQPAQKIDILGVALDELVARVIVVRLGETAVLAEIVQPHDLVTCL